MEKGHRHVFLNDPKNPIHSKYSNNILCTGKYNVFTWLPKTLLFQFQKIANVYFLFVSCLQLFTNLSPTSKYTTAGPLAIVLAFTSVREGFEDWKRHRADDQVNNQRVFVLEQSSREPIQIRWSDVKHGQIVKLHSGDTVPADCIILSTSESETGSVFVEMAVIDGETNFKRKYAPNLELNGLQVQELCQLSGSIKVEEPNNSINSFTGVLKVDQFEKLIPLTLANLLMRDSIVFQTDWVYAVVVQTGKDTKIIRNMGKAVSKHSQLDRKIDKILVCFLVFLIIVSFVASAYARQALRASCDSPEFCSTYTPHTSQWETGSHPICYAEHNFSETWGFVMRQCKNLSYSTGPNSYGVPEKFLAEMFITFMILMNNLIPISLYVTVEAVKIFQGMRMSADPLMIDKHTDAGLIVKTTNVVEDLGAVSYILTDKTGTLTENHMTLKRCSVAGSIVVVEPARNPRKVSRLSVETGCCNSLRAGESGEARVKSTLRSSIHIGTSQQSHCSTRNNYESLADYLNHGDSRKRNSAKELLLCMVLCSSVTCENLQASSQRYSKETGQHLAFDDEGLPIDATQIQYQYESPDEGSFVHAARELGISLIKRTSKAIWIREGSRTEKYKLLLVNEFSSRRKIMSVIVQSPTGEIIVYCKGADDILFARTALARRGLGSRGIEPIERSIGALPALSSNRKNDNKYVHAKSQNSTQQHTMSGHSNDINGNNQTTAIYNENTHLGAATESMNYHQNDETDMVALEEHVRVFAESGLRTMLHCRKTLSVEEFEKIKLKLESTMNTVGENRYGALDGVLGAVESQLEIIGATAVEDKLQRDAASTLSSLVRAGIKVWMITGDKMETALHVAQACKLIDINRYKLFKLTGRREFRFRHRLRQLVRELRKQHMMGKLLESRSRAFVVTGQAFQLVLNTLNVHDTIGTTELQGRQQSAYTKLFGKCSSVDQALADKRSVVSMFMYCATICETVIACRMSPLHKGKLAWLLRRAKPESICLAIGDGGNDVGMLQEANIGVGLSGVEGREACNASDFAMSSFRFLKPLLLVHGRYNLLRTSFVLQYSLYKNVVLVAALCSFTEKTMLSGTSLFESYVMIGWNTIFTSIPVIVAGISDIDLSRETVLKFPMAYVTQASRFYPVSERFNCATVFTWVCTGIFQVSIINTILFWCSDSMYLDLLVFGSASNFLFVAVVNFQLLVSVHAWSKELFVVTFGSILAWPVYLSIYSASHDIVSLNILYDMYGVARHLLEYPVLTVGMPVLVAIALLPGVVVTYVIHIIIPNSNRMFLEQEWGLRKIVCRQTPKSRSRHRVSLTKSLRLNSAGKYIARPAKVASMIASFTDTRVSSKIAIEVQDAKDLIRGEWQTENLTGKKPRDIQSGQVQESDTMKAAASTLTSEIGLRRASNGEENKLRVDAKCDIQLDSNVARTNKSEYLPQVSRGGTQQQPPSTRSESRISSLSSLQHQAKGKQLSAPSPLLKLSTTEAITRENNDTRLSPPLERTLSAQRSFRDIEDYHDPVMSQYSVLLERIEQVKDRLEVENDGLHTSMVESVQVYGDDYGNMKMYSLAFQDPFLEKRYLRHMISRGLSLTKGILSAVTLLFVLYTVGDPDSSAQTIVLRFTLAFLGLCLLTFVILYESIARAHYELLYTLSIVVVSIVKNFTISQNGQGGEVLLLMACMYAFPITFRLRVVLSWTVMLNYVLFALNRVLYTETYNLYMLLQFEMYCTILMILNFYGAYLTEKAERLQYLEQIKLLATNIHADKLLNNMLPKHVVKRMQSGKSIIADNEAHVAVLFCDIVGFSEMYDLYSPSQIVQLLDWVYSLFDQICHSHGLHKMETVGKTYMACAGLQGKPRDPERAAVDMGLDIIHRLATCAVDGGARINVRVGINCGDAVAGVVGQHKPQYCLFGDVVNTASRMQSTGETNRVHITTATYMKIRNKYEFEPKTVKAKGKGHLSTFLVVRPVACNRTVVQSNSKRNLLDVTNSPPQKMHSAGQIDHNNSTTSAVVQSTVDSAVSSDAMGDSASAVGQQKQQTNEESSLSGTRYSRALSIRPVQMKLNPLKRMTLTVRSIGPALSSRKSILDVRGTAMHINRVHPRHSSTEYEKSGESDSYHSGTDEHLQELLLMTSTDTGRQTKRSRNRKAMRRGRNRATAKKEVHYNIFTLSFVGDMKQDEEVFQLSQLDTRIRNTRVAVLITFFLLGFIYIRSSTAVEMSVAAFGLRLSDNGVFAAYLILAPFFVLLTYTRLYRFRNWRGIHKNLSSFIFILGSLSTIVLSQTTRDRVRAISVDCANEPLAFPHNTPTTILDARAQLTCSQPNPSCTAINGMSNTRMVIEIVWMSLVCNSGSLNFARSVLTSIALLFATQLWHFTVTLPELVLESLASDLFFLVCALVLNIFSAYKRESSLRDSFALSKETAKATKTSNDILFQMLPKPIVDRISHHGKAGVDEFKAVSILFSDIRDFTKISASMSASEVVKMLANLFSEFDKSTVTNNVFKVQTIGDAYVIVSGIKIGVNHAYCEEAVAHTERLIKMAQDMLRIVSQHEVQSGPLKGQKLEIRIGIHTGDIFGGVIGTTALRYDMWGKDVLIANQVESNGVPNRIVVSETTKQIVDQLPGYTLEYHTQIPVRNREEGLKCYLLDEAPKVVD